MLKKLLFVSLCILSFQINAQVGIGTDDPKTTLDVVATNKTGNSTNVEGILIPRVSRERAQSMLNVEKSTLIFVDDVTSGIADGRIEREGFYYHDGVEWDKVSTKKDETSQPISSKFFYMPSVVLPTNENDARILDTANLNFSFTNGEYVVNLYNLFRTQFLSPVTSSIVNTENSSLPGVTPTIVDTLEEIVLPTTAYHYFVTYADINVFEDIKLDANGILKYKVKSNSIIRTGTFMNIVIKSK